jgi:phosphoglycerate dehydrogenase-like enzyme
VPLDLAERYRIPVAHFGGSNASVVAEHTLLLILALYRKLIQLNAGVKSGAWRVGEPVLRELRGKRVGIVGMGYIGREVARRLRAFETDSVYFSRTPLSEDRERELGVEFVSLDDLLRSSDIVSLNVALTSKTRGMIGARELAMMKRDAIVVNTCRGPVVDENALYAALKDNKIFGAGLDVMVEEPPQPKHPLFSLPNVIFTPHTAGPTWENYVARFRNGFDNIQRVAAGRAPLWVVAGQA